MRRPAAYAPLSVTFTTGKTGTAIQQKHGLEGIAVWAAMIAAAKRGRGQIVFAHDQDWQAIGLFTAPSFSLSEFLKTTGQQKQTRTTRSGHVVYVHITAYERWNDDAYTQRERERKASKSAELKRNESGGFAERKRRPSAAEPEPEEEKEQEPERTTTTTSPELERNGAGLDTQTELDLVEIMSWIGGDADDGTYVVVRRAWTNAPEAARLAVKQSMQTCRPRHRAGWFLTATKAETQRART